MAAAARPRLLATAGAVTIAFSSVLVRQAAVAPSTAAVFRCAYALPVLGWLAWRERERLGPRAAGDARLAIVAGVLLAAVLVSWNYSIEAVGVGLSTVLSNLQVALVPLIAWVVLDERPGRRVLATLPVVLLGIVLISGVLEHGAYGDDPVAGAVYGSIAGTAYAGFLLLLRQASGGGARLAGPLFEVTAAAAIAAAVAGAALGDVDLVPSWPAHLWLAILALSSQVVGWLLITTSLPRLPAALASLLLTIQPVGSVILGALLFAEAPTALQLAGVALVLAGVVTVSARRGGRAARRPARQTRRPRTRPPAPPRPAARR